MGAWGPRATELVETGQIGAELDALQREFEAEGHSPRRVHLSVGEYYLSVAHAHVLRCLDAGRVSAEAEQAARDTRRAAKLPLFKAHSLVIDGHLALLEHNHDAARKALMRAQQLSAQERAPWVAYAVARGEALMLEHEGRPQAARERAMAAAALARDNGAVFRRNWIEERFALQPETPPSVAASTRRLNTGSSRRSHQLRALTRLARLSIRDLALEPQARAVLDELLRLLDADRGALLYERAGDQPVRVLVGRRRGEDWEPPEDMHRILDDQAHRGVELLSDPSQSAFVEQRGRSVAAALHLQTEAVGALLLERTSGRRRFGATENVQLSALLPQVSVALELARVHEERERLTAMLHRVEGMEALGRLARTVAHDIRNMTHAISMGLSELRDLGEDRAEAVDIIAQAAQGAATLATQLLDFSRNEPGKPARVELLAALQAQLPLLRGFSRAVDVRLEHDGRRRSVLAEPHALEQAIVNLVVNARDAMPDGGHVQIRVTDESVRPGTPAGAIRIAVTDDGPGMSPDILARIFEPFFTTKPRGIGSGLGLASVYAFAKRSGGVGRGGQRARGGYHDLDPPPLAGAAISVPRAGGALGVDRRRDPPGVDRPVATRGLRRPRRPVQERGTARVGHRRPTRSAHCRPRQRCARRQRYSARAPGQPSPAYPRARQ